MRSHEESGFLCSLDVRSLPNGFHINTYDQEMCNNMRTVELVLNLDQKVHL